MPNYNAPPTAEDLRAFLESGSFIDVAAAADLETPIQAAVELFEERTGYRPFLGEDTPRALNFDAPGPRPARSSSFGQGRVGGGRVLDLEGGIVGSPESITIDGDLAVEGEDFICEPKNAPNRKRPFTLIRFTRPVTSWPGGVVVTARWGFCLPDPAGAGFPVSAWQAILQGAASTIYYTLPNNPDVQSISRNGISESFEIASTMTPKQRGDGLKEVFENAVKLYRRLTV